MSLMWKADFLEDFKEEALIYLASFNFLLTSYIPIICFMILGEFHIEQPAPYILPLFISFTVFKVVIEFTTASKSRLLVTYVLVGWVWVVQLAHIYFTGISIPLCMFWIFWSILQINLSKLILRCDYECK